MRSASGYWKRPNEEGVRDAENGAVRADSDRQREDGDWGVAGGVAAGVLGAGVLAIGRRRRLVADEWMQVIPLAAAGLSYGLAAPLGGSGFIAAFVAGLVFGRLQRSRDGAVTYLVDSGGQVLNAVTLIVFGAIALGPALGDVDWRIALYAVLSLTVARMVPVALAFVGLRARRPTVAFVGWFGPRGLASIVFAIIVLEGSALEHVEPRRHDRLPDGRPVRVRPRPDRAAVVRRVRAVVRRAVGAAGDGERRRPRAPPAPPRRLGLARAAAAAARRAARARRHERTVRAVAREERSRRADVLVIFGITGDLARVMTFHSLYRLERRGLLHCPIVGVALGDWTIEQLGSAPATSIVATGEPFDPAVFARLAARLVLRRRRLRRRGHLRARGRRHRGRGAAGLLSPDPAVPLRHRRQGPGARPA